MTTDRGPVRVVRIIARLNIGGPAIQAITLSKLLETRGYATRLVRGIEGPGEGNMDYLADEHGVVPTKVASLTRDPGRNDLRALAAVIRILRHDRPHIVHTHAAKAGTIGRVATLLAFPRRCDRPMLVHTFHGHSLTGYFSDRRAAMYRRIERHLASRTDALVAVSPIVRDDLVGLGVASADRFVVIPLGFDLSPFTEDQNRSQRRALLRAEWGVELDAELVTLIARLVPIKRVDRFLRVAASVAAERPRARFAIVGDGELRDQLTRSPEAQALADRLIWTGFRRDISHVCFASDVVVLTSDNEGTPVSLIEAQAAAVPVVGTDVGGVRTAVLDGETGMLAAPADEQLLASHVRAMLDDVSRATRIGRAGREHAKNSYGVERLVENHDRLYRRLHARVYGREGV